MTLLRSIDRGLVRVEGWLLVLFLGTMVVLSFAQVVLRNVFSTGFIWADPLVRHMVLWVGFLGAAIATHEERHISIDALTRFLSPRWKAAAAIAGQVFLAVVCAFLVGASWTFLMQERDAGGEFLNGIPSYAALMIIPAGYLLIAVHALIRAMTRWPALLGRDMPKEA
jgi:TRAP-type C4-dicarboxylate transport system permease small subunit